MLQHERKEMGKRIRERRKAMKMTQEDLARKIEVKRVTVSKYESGDIGLSLDMIFKISEALEIDSDYLIFGEDTSYFNDPNYLKESEKQFIALEGGDSKYKLRNDIETFYYLLTEEGKKRLLEYIDMRIEELLEIPKYQSEEYKKFEHHFVKPDSKE